MRWLKKVLFVTAVIDAEYESLVVSLDQTRWYGIARSTCVQEVRNPGGPEERKLPPDTGSGYIWRVYSISRYEERNDGVYAELEALVLSRDIPACFRWLVDPIVSRISRNALLTSLEQTRQAVRKQPGFAREGSSPEPNLGICHGIRQVQRRPGASLATKPLQDAPLSMLKPWPAGLASEVRVISACTPCGLCGSCLCWLQSAC